MCHTQHDPTFTGITRQAFMLLNSNILKVAFDWFGWCKRDASRVVCARLIATANRDPDAIANREYGNGPPEETNESMQSPRSNTTFWISCATSRVGAKINAWHPFNLGSNMANEPLQREQFYPCGLKEKVLLRVDATWFVYARVDISATQTKHQDERKHKKRQ